MPLTEFRIADTEDCPCRISSRYIVICPSVITARTVDSAIQA